MPSGRNDPCPCGSGKKYKRCCQGLDREAGIAGLEAGRVRSIASGAAEWQADIVPFPSALDDDPAARLATVLVVADGLVVHTDVLSRPSPEPEEMAATLAAAVLAARERIGHSPERVVVREGEVADALARALARRAAAAGPDETPPPSIAAGRLPDLDRVAFALTEQVTGSPTKFFLSCPDTWAGWGLPEETVAGLFRAAAEFYRAAPWTTMANLDVLEAVMPAGNTWTAVVLGNAGQEFGLALYSEADDLRSMIAKGADDATAFHDLRGRVLSLDLSPGADCHKAMRREVAAGGWDVAGPRAYPRVFAINTPAGGLRRRDAADLTALLAAVPRFVAAHGSAVAEGAAIEGWRDRESGVVLSCRPEEADIAAAFADLDAPLAPGRAEGPGADPEAALTEIWTETEEPDTLEDRELAVVERFDRHLAEREGLSPATVAKHAGNAATFVGFLAATGVPVRAVHEYDLRVFLFDRYPRKTADGASRMATMPGSLRRFLDYLAAEEGISCPWAREILSDRAAIEARWEDAPGGAFWDPEVDEWRSEHDDDLYARLMLPDGGLGGDGEEWGSLMGSTEAQLHGELRRRWLLWRDELLSGGAEAGLELAVLLLARQRAWENSPHPRLAGKSPLEAIREERKRTGEIGDLAKLLGR